MKRSAATTAPVEAVVKGPSKFLSFLRKTPQPEPQIEEITTPKRKRGPFASLTSRDGLHRSPIRKSLRRQPSVDLNQLSRKVSSLEAQLKEARQELNTVVGSVRTDSSMNSEKTNNAILAKHQSLAAGDRYNGLVESLLGQQSPSYKQHTLSSSADLPRAYAEYLAVEEAFEAEDGFIDATPRQYKRKRQMDEDYAQSGGSRLDSPDYQSGLSQLSERPPTRRKSEHSKEMPPAPLFEKAPDSESDDEPATPTSRRPDRIKTGDLTKKRPHLPPPRLESLPTTSKPPLQQPHKPAVSELIVDASRAGGVVYEVSDREYTSSGTSSPFTPPAMQKENIDPMSSSPFHESPTPRSTEQTASEVVSKEVAANPQPVALTPLKRHVRVPAKLSTVDEEFEWNDEETF